MEPKFINIPKEQLQPKGDKKPSLFQPASHYTFLDCMIEVYHATLDSQEFKEVTLPEPIAEWCRLMYEQVGQDPALVKTGGVYKQPKLEYDEDMIVHLVTGGKDSTAAVLKYANQFKRAELFHVMGVNKIYPTEHHTVQSLYPRIVPNEQLTNCKVNLPRVINASESPIKLFLIIALAIDLYKAVPRWITIGGSAGIADVSEVEVYGDSGRALNPFFEMLKEAHDAPITWTPYLRDQVEAYELTKHLPGWDLCSCFSQLRFKSRQRQMALEKWGKVIDGKTYVAGTIKDSGKSIFDAPQQLLDLLSTDDLINTDEVRPDDDYRCIGGCFKCRERCIVNTNHFGYHYHPDYVKKSKEGIIGWMDKSPNNNGVKLERYFTDCLLIPMSAIPKKYHKYIAGEATRPDGWKEPKPRPAKKKQ